VDYIVGTATFDTFLIRTAAAILGIPAIFYRTLPPVCYRYFHIYFVVGVTYCFPFTYGFMLSMNAASSPNGQEIHMIWILQYFVALFIFIQLVVNSILASFLWFFASCLALLPVLFLSEINTKELERVFVYPITGYLTALGIGLITNRRSAIVNSEKAAAASAIGANLAHELRTPLASIGAMSKGVSNLLPVLKETYDRAKESGIPVQPLRNSQLSQLNDALASIHKEVEYSNTIIDMLLVNTADKPLSDVDLDQFPVRNVVHEAVERYPFNNTRERELISVNIEHDFDLVAPRLLVIHVLFNLIKNGLYFVQKAGKGNIDISTHLSGGEGCIVVHDTGAGVPAAVRPRMFERFYTTTHSGQSAGIGLSFCKLVMDSIGGKISCDSQEGQYTTFVLSFPETKL